MPTRSGARRLGQPLGFRFGRADTRGLGRRIGILGRGLAAVIGAFRLDERHDHEGAVTIGRLGTHQVPGPVERSRSPDARLDAEAADRRRPQIRHVQVGVDDLAQHLRDGRRGHQQHVDRTALGRQGLPFRDAEAMLLVDDREPQVGEPDVVLDQRLGAHEHEAPTASQERGSHRRLGQRQRLASFARAHAAGQQHDLVAERFHERAQGRRVLPGQQVGWRQQRGLAARVGDEGHGQCGDRGLARADVTLDETHHRPAGRKVGPDLVDSRALVLGQRHGHGRLRASSRGDLVPDGPLDGRHGLGETSIHNGHARGMVALPHPASGDHAHLECQQLVECQPLERSVERQLVNREVDGLDGPRDGHPVVPDLRPSR